MAKVTLKKRLEINHSVLRKAKMTLRKNLDQKDGLEDRLVHYFQGS